MPQPIDMQTELARTMLAERVQDISGRQSLAAAQRAQTEVDENRTTLENQVGETHEAESEQVDEEGRRKNPFAGRRHKRDGAESEVHNENLAAADNPEGHQLDISV